MRERAGSVTLPVVLVCYSPPAGGVSQAGGLLLLLPRRLREWVSSVKAPHDVLGGLLQKRPWLALLITGGPDVKAPLSLPPLSLPRLGGPGDTGLVVARPYLRLAPHLS